MDNITRNPEAANMEIQDLVKVTFYLVGDMAAEGRREVIAAWLQDHQPCMTLLYVAALAAPILRVEVDAWACCAEG